DANEITGNYVGTDPTGNQPVKNLTVGVSVQYSATNTLIQQNVISGNGGIGLAVSNGATLVQAVGNMIGTDPTGTLAVPNGNQGVSLNARDNTLTGNVISANAN